MRNLSRPFIRSRISLFFLISIIISLLFYTVRPNKVSAQVNTFGTSQKWHDYFAPNGEIPMTGDFDCNNFKDDIVTFTHDQSADVWVATNTGWGSDHFSQASKWHDYFAPAGEIPLVGDFNHDGCDDIITFTSDSSGDVWVALNNGGSDFNTASKWHDYFAPNDEIPQVGDFDQNGYDDIITFTSDSNADVWVALNNGGNGFQTASKWHNWFAPQDEIPAVGEFDGDNFKDDIVTFTNDCTADVWVAFNDEGFNRFQAATKWHDYFAPTGETPLVGDFDGDSYDDIITFTKGNTADIYIARTTDSGGYHFETLGTIWHNWFAPYNETPAIGDFDEDFEDDIITFTGDPGADVWVAINQ